MRQVNRLSKRSASSTKEPPRNTPLDCSSRPHVIRSDRQASSLHPTCCRGSSLIDKVTPTCAIAPYGKGAKENPEPALWHKRPRGSAVSSLSRGVCDARRTETMRCSCVNGVLEGLKGHRQHECRIGQRPVVIYPERYRYSSAGRSRRDKKTRHDLPLWSMPKCASQNPAPKILSAG